MKDSVPKLERPKSLTDLVTEHLRNWIITGEMSLGSRLSEVKIARALNVSRTPVREATNRLEIEGLLKIEPQRGSFVFSMDQNELSKLCDARLCLEAGALSTGITQNNEWLFQALSDCLQEMAEAMEAGDVTRYLNLDAEFHHKIIEGAENNFMTEAYNTIAPRMSALRHRIGRHPDQLTKSFSEHKVLCEAVGIKELNLALEILHGHIDRKTEGNYWRDGNQGVTALLSENKL